MGPSNSRYHGLARVLTIVVGIVVLGAVGTFIPTLLASLSIYVNPALQSLIILILPAGFVASLSVSYFQSTYDALFAHIESLIIRFLPWVLSVVAAIVVLSLFGAFFNITPKFGIHQVLVPTKTVAPIPKPSPTQDAFSVTPTVDQSLLGISDGSNPFDISLADGSIKITAGSFLKKGDADTAVAQWKQALGIDQNDAEALIYTEDQRVLASGVKYFSLVVVTNFVHIDNGQSNIDGYKNGASRDILEGVYVAQIRHNQDNSALQMILLIANVPNPALDAKKLALQIELAQQQKNKNIVGVVGWPYGSNDAIAELGRAKIPVVSLATFSSTSAGERGSYFFSVAPSIEDQARAADLYASSTWAASKAAIFYDPHDKYSTDLANAFAVYFRGQIIQPKLTYTTGHTGQMLESASSLIRDNPSLLIFFTGYPADAADLLNFTKAWPQVHVLAGDSLYQMVHCPPTICASLEKISFTAPAYPDEADCLRQERPAFFDEYTRQYDPKKVHIGNPYGYGRASSDSILAYDATFTFSQASLRAATPLTGISMQQALAKTTHLQAASGQISFGNDGGPTQKAVFILSADHGLKLKAMPVGYYNSSTDQVFCS